jgi:hypothetical protein
MLGTTATKMFGTAREAMMRESVARVAPYDVIRVLLGLILSLAAAFKGYELATEPVTGSGVFDSRWSLIVVVEVELALGLWLLSGMHPRETRWGTLVCFAAFAVVSLYKALSGEDSCGCFGKLSISPWYTLIFDAFVIVVLLVAIVPTNCYARQIMRFTVPEYLVFLALFATPAALLMANDSAATLAPDGSTLGAGRYVVLEPEQWIGKQLPLLRYIELDANLAVGEWTVILYRDDCTKCHALIDDYLHKTTNHADRRRIAFIEIPPFGEPNRRLSESGFRVGRLSDVRKWFVTTPVVIKLFNGTVGRGIDDGNR